MTLAVALALGLDWEDLVQAEALAQLEGVSRGAAWDRLARDLGWRRARPDLAEVELCGRTRASLSGDLAAAVHEAARIATTYHYRWGGLPAGPRYGVGGRQCLADLPAEVLGMLGVDPRHAEAWAHCPRGDRRS